MRMLTHIVIKTICRYHVKGLRKSVEEVKERNGPFAGKRVSRPVADYEACHGVVLNNVQKIINANFEYVIKVGIFNVN